MMLPLLLAALVASETPQPAAAGTPPPLVSTGHAEPGAAGLEVFWAHAWDEAVEWARKIPNGRILIYFADEDCAECSRMEALIIPTTSFYAFTRDKVPVRIYRSTAEGKRLSERLRVTDVPTWILVTPDLVVSGMQVGSTSQLGWIDTFIRAEAGWAGYRKTLADEAANPSEPALVFEAAKATYQRGGDDLAEPRFKRLIAAKSTSAEIRERSLAYLASIEMDAKRIPEATKHLDELLRIAKDPTLRERAELRRADVEIARGRHDLAIHRLEEFKKAHPLSPLYKEADALLDLLKKKEHDK
jgi:predicted negative regulator of RcsB-dependent stress response